MSGIDQRVLAVAAASLRSAQGPVVTPSAGVAAALRALDVAVQVVDVAGVEPASAHAVALLDDELSRSSHDEVLLAEAAAALRGGGLLAVTAVNHVASLARGVALNGLRGYRAESVERALGHHGIATELLCAPGAAATIAGNPDGPADETLDREPGLLDAAPRLLAVGRKGATGAARSATYFATLPRKIVAAAVLCRDDRGRVLLVHDSFKGHWTIPGGVVDRSEDPRTGAVREAWEEAGVRVDAGAVLGVFAGTWPDRVVFVYDARPAPGEAAPLGPVNAKEIDGVEWVDLDQALSRLAPYVAFQVRASIERPGGTHLQTP